MNNMKDTYIKAPYRSPLAIVEAMKDIIKDKVVCDVGCAYGDIMIEMKKYAKEVVGIDDKEDRITVAKERGLNVIKGDIFNDLIPEADVYYLWIVKYVVKKVVDMIPKGIIIVGADTSWQDEHLFIEDLNLGGRQIEVPYNEGEDWREKGVFKLFVIEK